MAHLDSNFLSCFDQLDTSACDYCAQWAFVRLVGLFQDSNCWHRFLARVNLISWQPMKNGPTMERRGMTILLGLWAKKDIAARGAEKELTGLRQESYLVGSCHLFRKVCFLVNQAVSRCDQQRGLGLAINSIHLTFVKPDQLHPSRWALYSMINPSRLLTSSISAA